MSVREPAITSTANPRVKAVARLRDRREREETGLTIIDGPRELLRALEARVEVSEAFVCEELVRSAEAEEAVARLRATGAPVVDVSEAVLGRLAFGDRTDGVVAIVRAATTTLADLSLPREPLLVVVEAVEKPGNLGAILRTADGAGVDALIAADPRTDLFNPGAIRASLGTIFSRPVVSATTVETLDWLTARAIRPIAARVDAPTTWDAVDLRGPVAIVVGSEAGGLSPAWDDPRVTPVRIPMRGAADSLNVSVAAAILLYEAVRQRS
ncbi:MAG TPA: RNA methyltransferase [Candidatus Limnocylindrales bacterium]|nr:RNA methyltransferase [Candidatus Limnocylindrales bacterium]